MVVMEALKLYCRYSIFLHLHYLRVAKYHVTADVPGNEGRDDVPHEGLHEK